MNSDLITARLLWGRGLPVPLDIVMRLAAAGHDVPALERKYAN